MQPVLVIKDTDSLSKGVFHTLRNLKNCFHSSFSLVSKIFLDLLLIKEEVEHRDLSHGDDRVLRDTSQDEWVRLVLDQHGVILVELIHFFKLVDTISVSNLTIVLCPVGATEEDHGVLPLVTNPALTTLHTGPLGAGMDLEMRVLRVVLIED